MVEFTHILCPVDFSDASARALKHAAVLAGWYSARLTVLHVVPTLEPAQAVGDLGAAMPVGMPVLPDQVLAEMRRSLDLDTLFPQAALVVEPGDARSVIVDAAISRKADLMVVGTHGRRGFKRLLLGSVAEALLREAPCPVLTVPPHAAAPATEMATFKRILCAMDFSPPALQALGFALDLARQADGRVTVLHAVEWLAEEEPRETARFDVPEYRRYIAADAEERLRRLVADESRTWAGIDEMVVFGRAHREILRVAEATRADLVVMGAQGRGGVGLTVFGSATQQVVRGAECPVLTVRGPQPA